MAEIDTPIERLCMRWEEGIDILLELRYDAYKDDGHLLL